MYNHLTLDEDLFDHLKLGDNAAYTELYQRYKRPLIVYALQKVDKEIAEDLIHDFFTRLWVQRTSLVIKEKVNAYMFRALRNRILDYIAHSAVSKKYIDSLEDFSLKSYANYSTDYKLREESFLNAINDLLVKYGDRAQAIVRLRMLGYSNTEIADKLGISEKTVRNQYSILTKYLKKKLSVLLFIHFF